jgi:hypothetical protein
VPALLEKRGDVWHDIVKRKQSLDQALGVRRG